MKKNTFVDGILLVCLFSSSLLT